MTLTPSSRDLKAIDTYGMKYDRVTLRDGQPVIDILEVKLIDIENYWRRRVAPKSRVYVTPEDFNVLGDMLSGTRYDRPEQDFKPAWLDLVREMTGDPEAKLSWSQKAGCSCPCSPGFILTTSSTKLNGKDVFIRYSLKAVR